MHNKYSANLRSCVIIFNKT